MSDSFTLPVCVSSRIACFFSCLFGWLHSAKPLVLKGCDQVYLFLSFFLGFRVLFLSVSDLSYFPLCLSPFLAGHVNRACQIRSHYQCVFQAGLHFFSLFVWMTVDSAKRDFCEKVQTSFSDLVLKGCNQVYLFLSFSDLEFLFLSVSEACCSFELLQPRLNLYWNSQALQYYTRANRKLPSTKLEVEKS